MVPDIAVILAPATTLELSEIICPTAKPVADVTEIEFDPAVVERVEAATPESVLLRTTALLPE